MLKLSARAGLLPLLALPLLAATTDSIRFNRDVRPILSDKCFLCHGPDAKTRMAGLRLDIRDEALKPTRTKATPIVPGSPEQSAVIQRIYATNARIMPPAHAHKELTEGQKETLKRWVAEGAPYEGHWSWQPVERPQVPAGETNPIDAFVSERLKKEGLTLSREADRRTLLRRVSLDLTGLPPTPEELAAFEKDRNPKAYERAVDRLMSSPRYAEKQAMYWLDAVRYGDSSGFHGDNLWPAWPYRDYVLKAIRDNMPFDRFTREQLAGDLLPDATLDQKVASAFNRMNRVSAEGGLQPKEYLAKYGADRVRTVSTVWMGATMGCAECHDHKFDPFTAKDFYSFKAFFADIKETGLVSDRGANAWGSKLFLPSPEQKAHLAALDTKIEAARKVLETTAKQLEEERWALEDELLAKHRKRDLAWKYLHPLSAASRNGAQLKIYTDEPVESNFYLNGSLASDRKHGDGVIVAGGPNPDNETYTVTMKPGAGTWWSLGIDVWQDESLPGNRLGRGADRFVLTEVEAIAEEPGGAKRPLKFALATSAQFGELPEHTALAAIDGKPETGWAVSFVESRNPFLALRLAEPVRATAGTVITLKLHHDSTIRRATIGRFRVAVSPSPYSYPEGGESARKARAKTDASDVALLAIPTDFGVQADVLKALETPEEERTAEQMKLAGEYFRWASPKLQEQYRELGLLELQKAQVEAGVPRVLLTERVRPRITRVLPRGDFLNETGEIVKPAVPAVFGKLKTEREATRLDLANWIVSKENPLTARVYVNRQWRQLFGTGLSKTLDDLGSQGEWPTHPELLDWLAAEFMQPSHQAAGAQPWDMKHLLRTIVVSRTYRQASDPKPEAEQKDPDNRLLARQNRYRVEAEGVHDIALSAAGLLHEQFGGASVKPWQPAGYITAMNFPKREYSESRGQDQYRRALYTQWQRTFLHPSLLTFDAPTREECTVNRVSSNTPLQALVLLNDPIFVEAARVFAQRAMKEGGKTFDERLNFAFRRALNREPHAEERRILTGLYKASAEEFSRQPDAAKALLATGEAPLPAGADAKDLAAMMTVTRSILNLHETITRN